MTENYPLFLDCEASSLSPDSFPIEIAWNNSEGMIESYLINIFRYPNEYDDWSKDAQSLHGITKQYLAEKGKEPQFVVDQMEQRLNGKVLLTDAPDWDSFWIRRLYESVNKECSFEFGNAIDLFNKIEPYNHIYKSQARKLAGHKHRAASDVKYLVSLYHLCTGARNNKHIAILKTPTSDIVSKKEVLKQRGLAAFYKQLSEAGGTYTVDEVSQLIGMAKIDIIERSGSDFLGVQLQNDISYPCWQFDGNAIVDNFIEIMAMLNTDSAVGIVQFFLTTDEDLKKKPIDVLKGGDVKEIAIVKILAKQFYRQVTR